MGDTHKKPRLRKIDWTAVIRQLEQLPPGTPVLVAELDQSVRTHIKEGRYQQINPALYDVWTEAIDGSRTQARIYMARKP